LNAVHLESNKYAYKWSVVMWKVWVAYNLEESSVTLFLAHASSIFAALQLIHFTTLTHSKFFTWLNLTETVTQNSLNWQIQILIQLTVELDTYHVGFQKISYPQQPI
jgi:hypothetical protein